MAPKVLYGKKKTTTRATTSFSKFMSPEKDGDATQHVGKNATAVKDNWRQQLEVAAESSAQGNGLEALEKGLESLRLEQTQTAGVVKTTEKSRSRKAVLDLDAAETKENQRPEDDTSSQEVEPSTLGTATVRRQKSGRRAPLNGRDAADSTDVKVQTLEARNIKGKGQLGTKDSPASPTRVPQPTSRLKSKPASSPLRPSLPTPEPTPEPDDIYTTYASPLLSMTDTNKIKAFDQWSTELEGVFDVTKIAEASFSEVYRLSTTSLSGTSNQESVLKLVALKTPPDIPLLCQSHTRTVRDREGQIAKERAEREEKDQWKSEVDDVVSEVKLLHNLAHIPGFTNFRDLTILQGRPTPFFAKAWKAWNKSRTRGKKSEFPDPSKKTSYEETQLWAVIEMQDAGTDCEKLMENGGLSSIWEVWDVFWGVCLSVAKAEETCKFEHRDLHMGNICVRSSRLNSDVLDTTIKDPTHRKFRFTGLETTVIDYTLSRADILASPSRRSSSSSAGTVTSSSSISDSANVAYLDLDKDPALFTGDASEEYQYEIYRYMRGAALYNNPLQSSPPDPTSEPRRSPRKNTHIRFDSQESSQKPVLVGGSAWSQFHPKTNLVWAHFLLHKLLAHLDSSANTPDQLSTKQIMADVEDKGSEPLKVKKKALKLHSILKKVSELLCPVALGRQESLGSVKDLVLLAIDERWLRTGDVVG
ncbi:hypothetical protein CC86DRAFT_373652 [Ophiobolus disseminans]|uniref:non-specific serine/threonine protein kinase n=1 Tax=Ophiobolus disseminans TaxID=1469910 RepID=A0A6A6ZNT5_9PLEO|nr:hypothetical protein CC86DRAFT_373652 [Ophiobolus disseminans]